MMMVLGFSGMRGLTGLPRVLLEYLAYQKGRPARQGLGEQSDGVLRTGVFGYFIFLGFNFLLLVGYTHIIPRKEISYVFRFATDLRETTESTRLHMVCNRYTRALALTRQYFSQRKMHITLLRGLRT